MPLFMKQAKITKPRLTRVESRALTRQKLLDCAQSVFLREGYSGATIEEISAEAGYTRGAFYAHFKSKEDVLLEIISSQADKVTPILIERIEAASSPSAMVEFLSEWAQERSQTQSLSFMMLEAMQQAQRSGALDERYAALFNRNWRSVGEAMRPFFPDQRLPCTAEELVAIIVALSYNPVVSGASGHKAGRLVELVLAAFLKDA